MFRSHYLPVVTILLSACSGNVEPEPRRESIQSVIENEGVSETLAPAARADAPPGLAHAPTIADESDWECAQARPAIDSDALDEQGVVDLDLAERASTERGAETAPVTIVVFSDFECPYCEKAARTVDSLRERYGDALRVVFKNKPLPIHEHAELAAKAALAAGEQGRFWEYHDALFMTDASLDRETLLEVASRLNLDLRRFAHDLDSDAMDALLAGDLAEAAELDVRGTPTFFINGRRQTGAQSETTFRGLIDRAMAEQGATAHASPRR